MKKIILSIGGMSCSACSSRLEKHLNSKEKIKSASVNLPLAQALIEYDDSLTIDDLASFISEVGFESLGEYKIEEDYEELDKKNKRNLFIFGILTIIVLYISMAHMIGLPSIIFLSMDKYPVNYTVSLFLLSIPFLIFGFDIFKSGIKNVIYKSPNMDTLVTLGVFSSFLYSLYNMIMVFSGHYMNVENLYFESCIVVIFFIKLGRFIDGRSRKKTTDAIKELVQITPKKALIKKGEEEKEVTIDEVEKGDILIAKPGMKIAVDGVIVEGEAHFDEAFITGEAIPLKKGVSQKVVAGSINVDGYILYQAEKIGKDSTISEIVKLVVEASNTKAPIARIADVVSGFFVPMIIVIAILTFVGYLMLGFSFNEAVNTFVTVLVVACPCALGLATPLAIVVSEGVCARNGILIKESKTLENVGKVDTIVFDKTGTLTYGNLKIAKIFNYSNYNDKKLLQIVSSIESKSIHPIALAFLKDNTKLLEVRDFKNITGIGVEGTIATKKYSIGNSKLLKKLNISNEFGEDEKELAKLGNSIIYVIEDNNVIGLIGVSDVVRDSSKKTIEKLKDLGIDVIMATGDNKDTASIIASIVGIDNIKADILPREKTKIVKDLIKEGKFVMMVGDGINDAPSLASSSIGVSVNGGTDIAANSADVILMNDKIDKVVDLICISKRTLKIIKENLFWAFFYNICMIPIAIGFFKSFGISMNPMFAGIAMTISSLTVVFNSLRLSRNK